ncbi:MAG: Zn-dependent exopeptidase M28 [Kiritimatiellae bacterium]|nr:Zn-dependent exopeptidase M28 [Kiritimatiellia bacterium]
MLCALLAAAMAFTPADARLARDTAAGLVVRHTPRDAGTIPGRLAANYILDAANATGMDARLDRFSAQTPSGMRNFVNVEARYVSDESAPWLVFVSHYDTKPGVDCPGANDGASTSGLLVALANAIYDRRPKGINIICLWTDGEECQVAYGPDDGLWGARHAAAKYRREGLNVRAVICFDMLGDADLHITMPKNTTPGLRRAVLKLAKHLKLEDKVSESAEPLHDDHVPFIKEGFRAVDLIDFDYGGAKGENLHWHTPADTMDKVSEESLLVAGRIAAGLINGLSDGR